VTGMDEISARLAVHYAVISPDEEPAEKP
jgi:hypothetical protein